MPRHYDAVFFDLLSALLDSWSLWDDLAGDSTLGREWRMHYLQAASNTERYRPYIPLIGDSAKAVGVARSQADILASQWSVTNCSEELGMEAAKKIGVTFDVIMTAERAGYYKPDRRVYEAAIKEIDEAPERILYVAGSPYDVRGAAATSMPVYWHNRMGLVDPETRSKTIETSDTLEYLRNLIV